MNQKLSYELAMSNNQKNIDVISVSSLNKSNNEVESRFVNLKYIKKNEWIFFSNYNSNKGNNFLEHPQASIIMYWDTMDLQIRFKAKVKKTSSDFSDLHFNSRSDLKNALAISSKQSKKIVSYEAVNSNFEKTISNKDLLKERPEYWGGFSMIPYYFEFWEGHSSRINMRNIFELNNKNWITYVLQP